MMSRTDTAVLVIDVQDKLLPLVIDDAKLVWNVRRLIDGAKLLGLPIAATEQYPQGLGGTARAIADQLESIDEKVLFSCRECDKIFEEWSRNSIAKILIAGMETHVCVQQTALDLIAQGFDVYLCVDAVSSRFAIDRETAIRRMESSGVTLVTTETALFEWCESSKAEPFKKISQLVQQTGP